MNIEIHPKDESTSWQDLVTLFHEAFQERLEQGLEFTCSFYTPQELERRSANNVVLLATDKDNGALAGTAFIEVANDKNGPWAYLSNMAISPNYKRCGIGSMLEKRRIEIANACGCRYVTSDTAVGAESSVKWHLKNGFKKAQLHSFSSTNYYSIIFRKQLVPHPLWSNSFYCWFRFQLSALKCRMCFHADGKPTWLMKRYLKIRQA